MDINFSHTNPTFVQHEGFYYLEFNGEFFKGCKRCGGEGQYSHNGEHSRCYDCDNTSAKLGEHLDSKVAAEKWCHERAIRRAQRDRIREAKRVAKINKRQAAWDDLAAAHPAVWALVSAAADTASYTEAREAFSNERDAFVLTLADKLWNFDERTYSARQIEVLQSIADRRGVQQAEAATHPAPSGRVAVTGVITSAKLVEGDYGTAYKILVKDDSGFKVWCTLPSNLAEEASHDFSVANGSDHSLIGYSVWFTGSSNEPEKFTGVMGRRLTFMAALEPSIDDVSFAFGKRPTKASWI